MKCQDCGSLVKAGVAVCRRCLLAKGQGRREPAKAPPTFHVPGTPVTYETYEPPAIEETGYLSGAVEQATEMMIYVRLCEELDIDPSGDPHENLVRAFFDLRAEKTEGARPIKGAPPAELEPTKVHPECTGHTPETQAALIDLLGRQLADIIPRMEALERLVIRAFR